MRYLNILLLLAAISAHTFARAEITLSYDGPPGNLVEVHGRNIHLNCYGQGRPTVIFDSGLGGFSLDWLQVQDLLQQNYQVCAYDRAGYGWSQIGPLAQDHRTNCR